MSARPRHTRRFLLLAAASTLLAGSGATQTKAPPGKNPRALAPEAARARLAKERETVLARVMPERLRKREARAQEKWIEGFQVVQSDHYLLFTNGPTTTSRRFADSLEELYEFVREQFPFEDIDRLLECYIFSDPEEYYRFCVEITGWTEAQARGTAGHASGRYYATYYQSPRAAVVMHEATHQIVHACLRIPGVGSWFQEGMAVYVENRILGLNPSAGMRARIKGDDYYHLEELFALPVLLSDPKGHGQRNYEQAGALIDFLVHAKIEPLAGRFPAFLDTARRQPFGRGERDSARLIAQVYALSLPELEDKWREHLGFKPGRGR